MRTDWLAHPTKANTSTPRTSAKLAAEGILGFIMLLLQFLLKFSLNIENDLDMIRIEKFLLVTDFCKAR